ncbi:MAG TPA: Type 1 glutamine amidotransferase-like domain-containing protein, partial [Bacteroidales bacterium]
SKRCLPYFCTTNDMPIVEPIGFKSFGFVPFQINPHYTEVVVSSFAGETRDQRITEFLEVNPGKVVVGLKEGTMLKYEYGKLTLVGNKTAKIFVYHQKPYEVEEGMDLNFLLRS